MFTHLLLLAFQVTAFCEANEIGLVVIGPEAPLVAGLADSLRAAGRLVFGPSAAAAALEGSKKFMKDICSKYESRPLSALALIHYTFYTQV